MYMCKVDVLLSVYNPDPQYLREQLLSLNNQTYQNMEIIIFDDCVTQRCDTEVFKKYLKDKKYRILPYKSKNLGYIKAFENLVKESDGQYIALCDQDDIWLPEKIEECVNCLQKDNTVLVATDRKLIDESGTIYCESVRHSTKVISEHWNTKDDIGVRNFFQACAPGMCMVMDGNFARSTIPFSENTGHDKWLLACANVNGGVSFLDKPLSYYRRSGKNVSGVLVGVADKNDYDEQRILPHLKLVEEFDRRYPGYKGTDLAYQIAYARMNHNIISLIKYRRFIPTLYKFEIILACIPNWVAAYIIKFLHKIK